MIFEAGAYLYSLMFLSGAMVVLMSLILHFMWYNHRYLVIHYFVVMDGRYCKAINLWSFTGYNMKRLWRSVFTIKQHCKTQKFGGSWSWRNLQSLSRNSQDSTQFAWITACYKLHGCNTSCSMVPPHTNHKKKQAHCLQAIGKVVLGLLWQGYKSSIAIMYS